MLNYLRKLNWGLIVSFLFSLVIWVMLALALVPRLRAQDSLSVSPVPVNSTSLAPVDSTVSPRDQNISFERLQRLDGLAFCVDEKASFWVDGDVVRIGGWELKATIAHEEKHREQYRRFPTCAAFDWYYNSSVGRLESEAEAYVAGWCAAYDDVPDPVLAETEALRHVASYGYDIYLVLQEWKKWKTIECPQRPEPSNLVATVAP